jgi:2-keto-4-pentenoate hydratase/2-oxohepta-3-ene-1,7-dioic acid hydratase in catechol pathway
MVLRALGRITSVFDWKIMKIARIRHQGLDSWGVVDTESGKVQPIRGEVSEWGPMAAAGLADFEPAGRAISIADVRFLPPMTSTTTIVGVGMNYWSHLEKLGVTERPPTTVGFIKPRAAIVGHDSEIAYPAITTQLDFEVELVAVVGLPDAAAYEHKTDALLGYTVGNDVSARDTPSPMGGVDLFSMKALDKSTPIGPWITTKDEFGGSGQIDVEITLRVNGERRQRDRTSKMIWTIDELLDYVFARTTLQPGDLLFTGTTDGVGAEDGRYLEPGDVVEAEVEGIGVLRNVVGPRL